MFIEIEKRYLPEIDNAIKRNFPEYFKKLKGLSKHRRKEITMLSQSEIIDLFEKYKNGDLFARDLLIYSQLKLVYLYTKRFHICNNGTNISEEDLLGFANLILLEILEDYNPYKDKDSNEINSFSSYIRTWLEFNLHTELKKYGLTIKLPSNKITEITLQKRYISKYEQRHGEHPKHGDEITFCERGIYKKIVFNLLDSEMHLFERENDEYVFKKSIKYDESETFEIKSGNEVVLNENDDVDLELFDVIKGDISIEINDNEKIIKDSIEKVLKNLSEREQEYISLFFFKEESLKNIPTLITPDVNNKTEIKTLNKTSVNKINISIPKKDESKIFISYNIISNHHTIEGNHDEIGSKEITPITHKCQNISTKEKCADFIFEILDINSIEAESITVEHETYKGSKNLDFRIEKTDDGKYILNFFVEYSYGIIFTSQTFLNNNENLLKKLRTKLIKLKKIS
jgi:DNA-directed RNA polymerase specialized sigma subunit